MRDRSDSSSASSVRDDITDVDFDICALRGVYSSQRAKDSNAKIVLGDPGLLASALLSSRPKKRYTLGVVPHFVDAGVPEVEWLRTQPGVKLISSIADDPRDVVKQIAECHFVVSSSLHGLIVADSVGTPNAHIKLSGCHVIGSSYKFKDYYSVFNDSSRHIELDSSMLRRGDISSLVDYVGTRYVEPANIEIIKNRLIEAFPV